MRVWTALQSRTMLFGTRCDGLRQGTSVTVMLHTEVKHLVLRLLQAGLFMPALVKSSASQLSVVKQHLLPMIGGGASILAFFFPYDSNDSILKNPYYYVVVFPNLFGLMVLQLHIRKLCGVVIGSSESLIYLLLSLLALACTAALAVIGTKDPFTLLFPDDPALSTVSAFYICAYCILSIVSLLRQRLSCFDEARIALMTAYIAFSVLRFLSSDYGSEIDGLPGSHWSFVAACVFALDVLQHILASIIKIRTTRRHRPWGY